MIPSSRVVSISSTLKDSLDDTPVSPSTVIQDDLADGGLEAWCTVFGSFICQFNGFGYANAYGVYQDFYTREFLSNESTSAISWIGSSSACLMLGTGLICGPLHDRGYFYHLFISGAILQCFSLFMLSLVRPGCYYQVFLAQGLGIGLGQGLMFVPSIAVISQHFRKRMALAMSIVISGISLGSVVHTIMLNKLINGAVGFAMGTRINAGFITTLLFVSCILVRPRYGRDHRPDAVNTWKAMKKCLTELPSVLLISGCFLFQMVYFYPFFYFQVDSIRHGLSTSFSFYSLVILSAGGFCGRMSCGFITRFIKVIDCLILSIAACSALFLGMIALKNVAGFVLLGLLYGYASGMYAASVSPLIVLLARDPSEHGVRMGITFAITALATLIGSPISGALLTSHYVWWTPAVFCTVISLLADALLIFLRIVLVRRSKMENTERSPSDLGEGS